MRIKPMSIHRRDAKRDSNEPEIVQALERVGAFVTRISGEGVPDLLVLFRGGIFLIEIKTLKGKLTSAQIEWHGRSLNERIPVHTVCTPLEALTAIGAID